MSRHDDRSETWDGFRADATLLKICLSEYWGGVEQTVLNDVTDLASRGVRVRLLCLEGRPLHESLTQDAAAQGSIELIPVKSRPREFFDLPFRRFLRRQVAEGVNIVHSHHTSLLGSIAPWLWSYPRAVLLASRYLMAGEDRLGPLHRLVYGRLDSLLVSSESLRANVLETHAIRERRVRVLNPGLDFERFDPNRVVDAARRSAWGADAATVVIGMVGRLQPEKGQEVFLKAAAGLLRDLLSVGDAAPRLKFVVVGEGASSDGLPFLEELRAMVRQFRIEDHVVFEEYDERVAETMQGFDIFVMPSRREGMGLVALEAMAMECPVVLSDTGNAREVVGNQEFGLTFRPEDVFDLRRKLRTLVLDRPLRESMGRRARAHVIGKYDRTSRMQRLLEIYERCLRVRQAF